MRTKKIVLKDYLKQKRLDAKLTQNEVAVILGYDSPQFVSNWERGISHPPVSSIKTLADAFNSSPEEMFEIVLEDTLEETTRELRKKFSKSKIV